MTEYLDKYGHVWKGINAGDLLDRLRIHYDFPPYMRLFWPRESGHVFLQDFNFVYNLNNSKIVDPLIVKKVKIYFYCRKGKEITSNTMVYL